ncbi:MAG: type II toxin-antitoxin system RelE/ParE family toxin [Candidatus Omnitrophota bacterium]
MNYRILYDPPVEREFAKINRQNTVHIVKVMGSLAKNPRPRRSQKLHGRENQYRIRIGDYQVIYVIDDEESFIRVAHIKNRKDVYR